MSRRLPREIAYCKICGGEFTRKVGSTRVVKTCSTECKQQLAVLNMQKKKQEIYGDACFNNRPKAAKTNKERYGVTCTLMSESVREQARLAILAKYHDVNVFGKHSILRAAGIVGNKDFRNPETQAKAQANRPKPIPPKNTRHHFNTVNGKHMSKNQEKLFAYLKDKYPHIKFDSNSKIPHMPYQPDILLTDHKVIIEVNGGLGYYHDRDAYEADEENGTCFSKEMIKEKCLEKAGYVVLSN